MNMPVAAPAPVAPVAPSYLQNQYGLLDGLFIQNLDFVNPMDGRTYHTALQELNLWNDFKNGAKKAMNSVHGSVSGDIAGVHMEASRLQELNLWNDFKNGAKKAMNSVHGSVSGDIAGVHMEASRLNNLDFVNPMDGRTYHTALNNLDFVNPMDGRTYHTALQELNLFNDAIAAGKKEFNKLHFDEKVNVGGVDLHFKK
jgi:hypothetical protein